MLLTVESQADALLQLAGILRGPELLIAQTMDDAAVVKLALDLDRNKSAQFQSLVEDWNVQRIVKELY